MHRALLRRDHVVLTASVAFTGDQSVRTSRFGIPAFQNLELEELTWPQIDALDRERTLFILPVG